MVRDRSLVNSYVGANIVTDQGSFNDDGRWEPAEVPDPDGADVAFIRAVEMTMAGDESP